MITQNGTQGKTQDTMILEHLQKYGWVTPLEALNLYGCFRLSARIYCLRKKGYIIETDHIKKNGKVYAKYIYKGHENDFS